MEHHRLITAEKVLLQKTLLGSIRALVDVLSLINPIAFSRARQIRNYALDLAKEVGMKQRWRVEAAALLSQIGYIALPAETVEKIYQGEALTWEEETLVSGTPRVAEQLLRNIPRLEPVLEILRAIDEPLWKNGVDRSQTVPLGARILKIAIDFDRIRLQNGGSSRFAVDTLRRRDRVYDPRLLELLDKLYCRDETGNSIREIPLRSVTVGMVLADEVRGKNGVLIAGRNFEVTETFLERIKHIDHSLLKRIVKVYPRENAAETH